MSAKSKQLPLPVEQPREKKADEKQAAGHQVYLNTVLPIFKAAVERVTSKECAELFDVQPSSLSEALTGASSRGREAHLEWLVQLLLWAPVAIRRELLATLCSVADFKAPEPKRELTESDELRIYRMYADRVPGLAEVIAQAKESFR